MAHGKPLPFSINRNDTRTLLAQVVDGFRETIVGGYYAPGDVLPTSRELARLLGVSMIVSAPALKRLADEGFVLARPRVGTVVRDRAAKQWRGHVVMVGCESDHNYLQTIIAATLRDKLLAQGYLFTLICVRKGANRQYDYSPLEAALSRSVNLVLTLYNNDRITRLLASRHVPFAVFREKPGKPPAALGGIHLNHNLSNRDFAAKCAAIGAKKVVEVYWDTYNCDVTGACHDVGIAVERIKIFIDKDRHTLLDTKRAGYKAFSDLLRDWASRHPKTRFSAWDDNRTVYLVADDYLASGALLALSEARLDIPGDVRFATWANTGLGPLFNKDLSRMEFNPVAAGKMAAAATLEYLETGIFPSGLSFGPKWVDGETL